MSADISVIEGDGSYYIVFDSEDIVLEDGDVETGDAYDVRLRIKDERLLNPDEDELEDGDISDFNQVATTSFSVEEAEGSFDEPVEVLAEDEQSVTGTTNVAPGNTLNVRARSDNDVTPGFVVSQSEIEVQPDGTFTADQLDFSDASVGDSFTVTTRNSGFAEQAEADGSVVETIGEASFLEVSGLEPAEATATAGDSVTVSATIENTGGNEVSQTVALTLDGNELDTTDVTLAGGASQTVEFTADTSSLEAGATRTV